MNQIQPSQPQPISVKPDTTEQFVCRIPLPELVITVLYDQISFLLSNIGAFDLVFASLGRHCFFKKLNFFLKFHVCVPDTSTLPTTNQYVMNLSGKSRTIFLLQYTFFCLRSVRTTKTHPVRVRVVRTHRMEAVVGHVLCWFT